MQGFGNRRWLGWLSLALVLAVAGCSTAKRGPAPVERRKAKMLWYESFASI